MQGRTTFVTSHRFSLVRGADKFLVFEEGQLVEAGNARGADDAGRPLRPDVQSADGASLPPRCPPSFETLKNSSDRFSTEATRKRNFLCGTFVTPFLANEIRFWSQ